MRHFRSLALGLALTGLALTGSAAPAMAQLSGGMGGPKAPQPQPRTPDIAPPALPGAPAPVVNTGPDLQKAQAGDPTQDLFAAIIKGDDSAAQTALGRGADLSAQNQFGETPLDLAIALNRTSIAFLLLQTRNELVSQGRGPEPIGEPWLLNAPTPDLGKQPAAYKPPAPAPKPRPAPVPASSGTPDPNAGFLGFGAKN